MDGGGAVYEIQIKRSAEKDASAIPDRLFERVMAAILRLESEPRPRGVVKLRGIEKYHIRVGSYRVLYTIDDSNRRVEIVGIGHRRDVYRGL